MYNMIDKKNNGNSLYHQVIENIRKLVMEGKLKAGEKLPSERELAEMYGVSRVPVREALKTLEFLGIVQSIRGDGVYIQKLQAQDLLENVVFAVQEDEIDFLQELFEARVVIEVKAVKLAALRRTEENLEEMIDAVLDMERDLLLRRDASSSSYRFHSAIIHASQNRVLYRIHNNLSEMLKFSRKKSLGIKGHGSIALEFHKKILNEIRLQNPKTAGELMLKHLEEASQLIENEQKSHEKKK
jgi:GntR family transcriptional regulator, transcriptional repressor for pyruvate dehydrogenase complex